MAISAFLLAILEQAKEPLQCLNGAGYFTPEEWVQLDLIMNKKYTWTKGPTSIFYRNSIDRATHLNHETSSFFTGGCKDMPSLDAISLCASIELPLSDTNRSPGSLEAPWKFSVGTNTRKPFESSLPSKSDFIPSEYSRGQRESSSYTSILGEEFRSLSIPSKENFPGYPLSNVGSDGKSPISSSAQKMKSISAWTSEVQNNTVRQISSIHKPVYAPSISSQQKNGASRSPKSNFTGDQLKVHDTDVKMFETSNAAEWDDNMSRVAKKDVHQKEESSTSVNAKYGKDINLIVQEGQSKKNRQQAPSISNFSSRIVTRSSNRSLDVPRLTRHKASKDRKIIKENDTGTQQKTRVCWFWAESPSGCRYKQDECLNLHVKPTLNRSFKHSIEDVNSIRPSRGSNNSRKPLTCRFWASTGSCSKGDKCKDVHGWVIGGVVPSPKKDSDPQKNLDKVVLERKVNEDMVVTRAAGDRIAAIINQNKQESNVMELVDLRSYEHDTDDRNPPQSSILMSLDPTLNSSRIHV